MFEKIIRHKKESELLKKMISESETRGKSLGLAEGKSLGLAEGIEQTKKATAKELYKNNVSMNIIQKVTGFSEAQIRNICL